MQATKDSNYRLALRRSVKETILLAIVFLIALTLFFVTLHFIGAKEAGHELQQRPRGLIFAWLTTITIGLLLGKTRQGADGLQLPKPLIVVRESLQVLMLLLCFGVLAYASYYLYTTKGMALKRPWGILIGWFAFLMFLTCFAKTRGLLRFARQK